MTKPNGKCEWCGGFLDRGDSDRFHQNADTCKGILYNLLVNVAQGLDDGDSGGAMKTLGQFLDDTKDTDAELLSGFRAKRLGFFGSELLGLRGATSTRFSEVLAALFR